MLDRGVALISFAVVSGCGEGPPASDNPHAGAKELVAPQASGPNILAFTRTQGFRHDSIPAAVQALTTLAEQNGFGLTETQDSALFTDATLAQFSAVAFVSTTGDVLNEAQQAAFERYLAAGHGYVGVHAAADCEYDWPFYGGLVGAYFAGHSLITSASVKVETTAHPSTASLSSPWTRSDEWYGFRANPRQAVTVLLSVDETSYDPGEGRMGADHPVAWYHSYQGGRAFYTALGHTPQSFSEPQFLSHLLGGIEWAAGVSQ
jgi:cytochrome c